MERVAVLGGGAWGTAFAKVLADARPEADVQLWLRDPQRAELVQRERRNERYLPGIDLPAGVTAGAERARALAGADVVVLAVPSQTLRGLLTATADDIPRDALLVSLMKGLELGTSLRMSEVVAEVTGADPGRIAVVSGPNLALEIGREQPTATVVASASNEAAERLQHASRTSYFRPYTNTDVVGVELGGVVKNVIALMTGMAEGMGFGDNTKASIITRGLAETGRLGVALGADPLTFAGLAGLGDLVATCSSPLSRNRTFGEQVGRGKTVAEVTAAMRQVAEGVTSSRAVADLAARVGVDMPITSQAVRVLHEGLAPAAVVRSLMSRSAKAE
ncbi:MAG: glycerol-3-phosphate dehydrogenase [Mycobacterium sp.]|jgi:glycerol-3-phosphate dehydrogenase (NAD(P)+)|nr:glycerol-3-phosphate dehydrogenase [Mycobacterium sp.]